MFEAITHAIDKTGKTLKPRKISITLALCLGFLGIGACIALPGPTLKELCDNINETVSHTSWIFTARSVGYLFGSIMGGIAFDSMNEFLMLSFSILLSSIAVAVIPWCSNLPIMASMFAVIGVTLGCLESGGNVACIRTFEEKSLMALQFIYFSFGFGAFIAPLLCEPFLTSDTKHLSNLILLKGKLFKMHQNNSKESLSLEDLISSSLTNRIIRNESKTCQNENNDTSTGWSGKLACTCSIKCPYTIVASFLFFASFSTFLLYLFPNGIFSAIDTSKENMSASPESKSKKMELLLLVMLSNFFFGYQGLEVTFGGLVAFFSTVTSNFTEQEAAILTSVFWAAISLGRFVSMLVAHLINPKTMIIINLILTLCSSILLSVSYHLKLQQSGKILYVATSCLGLGLSSIFPAGVAWIGNYVKLTGKYASLFVIGSALGEMVLPIFGANLMMINKHYFTYFILSIVIYCFILFLAMSKVSRVLSKKSENAVYNEIK